VTWRYGIVLLVAAGAIQVSTVAYHAMSPFWLRAAMPPSAGLLYLAGSVVLAVAVVVLAVVWKLNWYFLLLLAVMSWPYAIQLAFTATGGSTDLLGNPTPAHLTALFVPPVLFACATVLAAVAPRRSRPQPS
jgi:hypothetical protein